MCLQLVIVCEDKSLSPLDDSVLEWDAISRSSSIWENFTRVHSTCSVVRGSFFNNRLKLADHEVTLQFRHFPCKAGFTGMEKFDKGSFYYLLWEFQVTVASLGTPETLDPIQNSLIEFIPSLEGFPNVSDL